MIRCSPLPPRSPKFVLVRAAAAYVLLLVLAARGGAQVIGTVDSTVATRANAPPAAKTGDARTAWVTRSDAEALGAAVLATAAAAPFDRSISNEVAEPNWRNDRALHHAASDAAFLGGSGPFVVSAALFAASATTGAVRLRRFAIHNMEAIALATAITGLAKGVSGRALPGVKTVHEFELGRGFHEANGPFVSFPSGHTAAAFAMAATIAGEVQRSDSSNTRTVDVIAFAGAATVGVARVIQHVHWASDLPLAAVIGTWSGRAIQRHADDGSKVGAILRGLMVAPGPRGLTRLGWSSGADDAAAR